MYRWSALAVFVVTIGISAYRRSQARRSAGSIPRLSESRGLILGRIAVAGPLFGGVVTYLANPRWMAWASFEALPVIRWSGLALGVLVVPSVYWVLTALGANVSETVLTKERHGLVTSGPYRWVRHPLYTAGSALFLSMGLIAANWFILLWGLIAVVALRAVIIPREEAHLEASFGDEYRRYRAATGTLLPALPGVRSRRRAGESV